ncbi:MAG: hypothetical protein PHF45_00870 [Candidatus Pacebacteria bacterium]|nr:hypothetical protein [Candidatus Paceibacterota bacterium]
MFILDVAPLTHIPMGQPQIFSYFSKTDLKRGCLVEIPLNQRKIMAVVLKSENISLRKVSLKKADFVLKPVNKVIASYPIVPPLFFVLADFISHYYFSSITLSLKAILPSRIKSLVRYLEGLDKDKFPEYFKVTKPLGPKEVVSRTKNLNFTNDFSLLVNEIKNHLIRKQQVLILTPTIFHQNYYKDKFLTLLDEKIYTASPDLKVKEFNSLWSKINAKDALLVIGRRSSVFLPWQDLGLIIVIDGNNPSHKSWDQKPYYNAGTLANYLSLYYYADITYYQNY